MQVFDDSLIQTAGESRSAEPRSPVSCVRPRGFGRLGLQSAEAKFNSESKQRSLLERFQFAHERVDGWLKNGFNARDGHYFVNDRLQLAE